ncbi:hypothetical protein L3Q65_09275 [Amycolatopsis sp. FU40]|uniref:hypothetical protein n=1 Tax=Amycolatopsis sp. FU40 TaxID=2914159 RepID=UPI001F25C64A|nr:hypothetical protein [Amycolatopsis sp. FU40]UKD56892.1 hypothetical protein L3Q65_09275 [Amycolatopsis sp. FU40]
MSAPVSIARTNVKTLTFITIWILVAGDVLLGTGFIMLITAPPHSGANIGAGGAFTFGLGGTVAGLLIGMGTAVAALRVRRREGRRDAHLLAWEKRLRRLTAAAVGLVTIGGLVLCWATVVFMQGRVGSGIVNSYSLFVTGMCIAGCGLLAGTPHTLYWLSRQRTRRHFARRA